MFELRDQDATGDPALGATLAESRRVVRAAMALLPAAQREVLTATAIALSIGLAIAFALACCSRARSQRWSRPHDSW